MKKCLCVAGVVALALIVVLSPTGAQGDKAPTIKDVMGKLNKGPNAMTPTIGKDLKDDPPAWDDLQKETKDFVKCVEALGKNTPPKGEKDSWEKLTKAYLDNAKALEAATAKKDKKAAQDAYGRLAAPGNCKACHSEHKKA
jgi:hypothetical protein